MRNRVLLHLACVLPVIYWLMLAQWQQLGANPVEFLIHDSGLWSLRILWLCLACTPLALAGWRKPLRYRRALGLWAFGYMTVHVLLWAWFDWALDITAIYAEIIQRGFLITGTVAWLLLIPLALTSTHASIRLLGGRWWKRIHWLVYPAALLSIIHFVWLVKKDIREPLIYLAILGVLLGVRVWNKWTTAHQ